MHPLARETSFSEAQRMLGDPDRRVIDVALDLGYSDHAHFTRAFERWTGIPPREFRRRVLEGGDPVGPSGPHARDRGAEWQDAARGATS
jgi:AraC-like DNA-binding protein